MRQNASRRPTWMAAYERAVVAACPELAGRVDWDTAVYLYDRGLTADEAATRTAERQREKRDD